MNATVATETLASVRERNDLLRTKFEGGKVVITPTVYHIDPQIRGRALYRLTLCNRFSDDCDDHSEGAFTFAGYFWIWKIDDFAGECCLTLSVAADLL
jgi:hypothetical protein